MRKRVWVPSAHDVLLEIERGVGGQADLIAAFLTRHKILFSPITANALLWLAVGIMRAFGDSEATILARAKQVIRQARNVTPIKHIPPPKIAH